MEKSVENILVIKLRAIGDVVLSTAVLPNLRHAYPNAQIYFITEKSCSDVLSGNPFLNRVLTVPPDPWKKPLDQKSWVAFFRFLSCLRRQKYNLVLDLFGNPRSAWLTWFSGAPVRVGFEFRGRKFAYNKRIHPQGNQVHEVEFNLDAVRALNIPVVDSKPLFPFSQKDVRTINSWMDENGLNGERLAAFHVWGSWPAKRWGLEKFKKLADSLVQKYGLKIILLWGPGEKLHVQTVQRSTRGKTVLAPEMTLKELGALLSKCVLVVANDSGPMHIAAAVGTPTVGIFGPTNWKLQGPYGKGHAVVFKRDLDCLGCNRLECKDMRCMNELGVQEVIDVIDEIL